MTLDLFKSRAESVEKLGEQALQDFYKVDGFEFFNSGSFNEFRASALTLLIDIVGHNHTYYKEFDSRCNHSKRGNIQAGLGILRSVITALEKGWLTDLVRLVSADVFSNFMDMAEHLLSENYKDPAAVMIGSVLEQHLKRTADNNGVATTTTDAKGKTTPKRAGLLNDDLVKAGVYNALDHKQVVAWLGIRNDAAHGDYGNYKKEQVDFMYQGVLNFISRVS